MNQLLSGPVQIAYHVKDVRESALKMVEFAGAGPFFLAERIELADATHRGEPCRFIHTSAYGQSGSMMVELVEQNDDGPSPFRDLYGPEEEGLHHVAYMARDLEGAIGHLAEQGFPLATRAETSGGQTFVFVDATERLGHMIELYEPTELLVGFYEMVRKSAEDWQGEEPLRSVG
jgi:hypothetical protein